MAPGGSHRRSRQPGCSSEQFSCFTAGPKPPDALGNHLAFSDERDVAEAAGVTQGVTPAKLSKRPSMWPGLSRGELPAGFNLLSGFTHVGQRPVCVSHSTIRRRPILRDRLSSSAETLPFRSMPKGANTCRRTQPWQTQPAIARPLPWCSPEGKEALFLRAGRACSSSGHRRRKYARRSVGAGIP